MELIGNFDCNLIGVKHMGFGVSVIRETYQQCSQNIALDSFL